MKVCTVDLEVRSLERRSVQLAPSLIWMESETVQTQYITTVTVTITAITVTITAITVTVTVTV